MAIDRELLGKSIRQVRGLRGPSQAALAEAAGIQGNSLALIERGERGVSVETLNALADALRVPAGWLAMLGTSEVARDRGSASLVSSLQKLILATMVAQETVETREAAEKAKQRRIDEATRSLQQIVRKRLSSTRKRTASPHPRKPKKLKVI